MSTNKAFPALELFMNSPPFIRKFTVCSHTYQGENGGRKNKNREHSYQQPYSRFSRSYSSLVSTCLTRSSMLMPCGRASCSAKMLLASLSLSWTSYPLASIFRIQYIIDYCGQNQVIIAENELPENVDYSTATLITFSQEEGEGLRYGFLKTPQN